MKILAAILPIMLLAGCDFQPSADQTQANQQEKLAQEATAQTGMPAIKNFRERKMLKEILELRDQANLVTYTYIVSEMTGRLRYLGQTVGYGIPYATQYTSPERPAKNLETSMQGNLALPQADPNGLFSPSSADGSWILMKDPNSDKVTPVYIEPRILVSQFKLPDSLLAKD